MICHPLNSTRTGGTCAVAVTTPTRGASLTAWNFTGVFQMHVLNSSMDREGQYYWQESLDFRLTPLRFCLNDGCYLTPVGFPGHRYAVGVTLLQRTQTNQRD